MVHWADVLARDVADESAGPHVLATAITPSGPIHVGNMREVLTTDAVHRALLDRGARSELLYIGDTYDPLRKVYPFLDKGTYEEHVGKPLSEIPCPGPDGKPARCHPSYAHHFLEPFLQALSELGVRPRVMLAHEMYERGDYVEATLRALERTTAIRDILVRVAKREGKIPESYLPFNVQCERCRRLNGPVPLLYETPYVEYACKACGHEGRKDVRQGGGGKLPWRVDWPARWWFLGVTFEAMGKDHAAAGSSWDTGVEIVRDVYGRQPPARTVYEFIQLKGVGAMHSSTGTAVAATDMLKMTPPEVLRFLLMRPHPSKHIDFDPGDGVATLVDEYDAWDRAKFGKDDRRPDMEDLDRVIELSEPEHPMTRDHTHPAISWQNLAILWQANRHTRDPLAQIRRVLQERQGVRLDARDEAWLQSRVRHVAYWLSAFAPDKWKFTLHGDWSPALARGLDESDRRLAATLAQALSAVAWEPQAVHDAVYAAAEKAGLPGKKGFEVVYKAFLGQPRGPRAGYFLASLERDFVARRLQDAAAG
ncbi:MAG TPA: lysine--tRNA ligase [Candidatus Thermoplasmatota archaeon]|nr:lysine--tRNA ligase [Candidatus Thermoplasmatota archaeon]